MCIIDCASRYPVVRTAGYRVIKPGVVRLYAGGVAGSTAFSKTVGGGSNPSLCTELTHLMWEQSTVSSLLERH